MLDYYNKRLNEYEAIYLKPERQADLRTLIAKLQTDVSNREVLELACGTGWWTQRLATYAASWTATDADPAALKRANEILKLASAFFAQAELDRRLK